VLEVLYHHGKFGGARILSAAGVANNVNFLSVSLSVTLLNVRDCAPDFAMKPLEYRNDFDAFGYGKVCCCACVFNFLRLQLTNSTFSDCCQLATPLNAEVQKTAKIVFFTNRGRPDKPIETKFGTQAYTAGLL